MAQVCTYMNGHQKESCQVDKYCSGQFWVALQDGLRIESKPKELELALCSQHRYCSDPVCAAVICSLCFVARVNFRMSLKMFTNLAIWSWFAFACFLILLRFHLMRSTLRFSLVFQHRSFAPSRRRIWTGMLIRLPLLCISKIEVLKRQL